MPIPPAVRRWLALDDDDLLQRVHRLGEISLRRHDRVDRFVRGWRFIDHVSVPSAFDAR